MAIAPPTSPLPRNTTSYLKGIAILAVIVNHYALLFFSSSHFYANSLMSLFFLLSGAGIYLSLELDAVAAGGKPRVWTSYLFKRASRIYPLYWFAYAIFVFSLYAAYGYTGSFEVSDILLALVGIPVDPRGIFWFVTSILQCYLFGPLLYLVVKRQGALAALGTALMLMAVSLLVSVFMLDRIDDEMLRDMLKYKELFLGNVLLFFLGMLIPSLVSSDRERFGRTGYWAGSAAAMAIFVYLTDVPDRLFPGSEVYLAPLLFLSAFALCVTLLSANPRLLFSRSVGRAGDNSYPLYLLHLSFFILLVELGIIREDSFASIAYTLLLFPLFFIVCMGLQSFFARARSGWGRSWI